MSENNQNETPWIIAKTVVATAGIIYLVSLATWFAHWAVVFGAVAGVGLIGYKASQLLKRPQQPAPKQLRSESPFDRRFAELEAEERVLDHEIGI